MREILLAYIRRQMCLSSLILHSKYCKKRHIGLLWNEPTVW